jgi:hypothetical protein
MADNESSAMLVVPQGEKPIPDKFIDFLWDKSLGAYLVKPEWVPLPSESRTGMGIRISPGSC